MLNQIPATPTTDAEATAFIRGACPHDCPDACGTITEVTDGRAVAFYGDPDHPITNGWVCGKVRPYLDALDAFLLESALHPAAPQPLVHPLDRRLLAPLQCQ